MMIPPKTIAGIAAGIGLAALTMGLPTPPKAGPPNVFAKPAISKPAPKPKLIDSRTWEDGSYRILVEFPAREEISTKAKTVTISGCLPDHLCSE